MKETEDDKFYDAQSSELFFTVNDGDSQLINEVSVPKQESTVSVQKPPQHEEVVKKKYPNVMENLVSQDYIYKTKGMQIIFINDYDNVFCPVIDIEVPELEMISEIQNQTTITTISVNKFKVSYFNSAIGDWEPFIENIELEFEQTLNIRHDNSAQSTLLVNFPSPVNINLTESCLTNLIETYYSWMETPPYQIDDVQALLD